MRYEQPNMEIIELMANDVIRTSNTASSLTGGNSGTGDTYDPVKDPNVGW